MTSKNYILVTLICIIVSSCSTSKTIKFTPKNDEIVNTQTLRNFLNINKNPKVVLRVNDTSFSVTEGEDNDYIYNAIENELLSNGFIVRDRQLFNQIITNDENNVDYQKLKEQSDTDLIIELVKLNPEILYETNKYYDKNDNERLENSFTYKRYGASVEFKVIMIDSNEFAGVYKFNYTPCVDGCVISKSLRQLQLERKNKLKEDIEAYEGVERDELEIFIKDATKKLVSEMRK